MDVVEKIVAIIPIRDGIIFPNTDSVLTFGRPKSLAALESSYLNERMVVFALQKNSRLNEPSQHDLFEIGTLARIERMIRTDGEINAQVRGISRVKILGYEQHENFLLARVIEIPDEYIASAEVDALCNHLTAEFRRAMNLGKAADFLLFMNIMSENTPSELSDLLASALELKPQERQELLEMLNVKARLQKLTELLAKEIKILELERRIASKTQERFEKGAREAMLRERLRTIEEELGEKEENSEIRMLLNKIKAAKMPDEVEEKSKKELNKLQNMNQF